MNTVECEVERMFSKVAPIMPLTTALERRDSIRDKVSRYCDRVFAHLSPAERAEFTLSCVHHGLTMHSLGDTAARAIEKAKRLADVIAKNNSHEPPEAA